MSATSDLLLVVLAIAAVGCKPAAKSQETVRVIEHRVDASPGTPPRIHEELATECGQPSATMKDLMNAKINALVTKTSYYLYHDRRDTHERMESVARTSAELLACILEIPEHRAKIALEQRSEYYQLLAKLQEDAYALHVTSLEMSEEAAHHWFFHLKQDCAACHARFRQEH